jgi:hypothetical protein
MYGAITKNPSDFEEYVSLHQLDDIDKQEENSYCNNARNIGGCVLVFTSICSIIFFYIISHRL